LPGGGFTFLIFLSGTLFSRILEGLFQTIQISQTDDILLSSSGAGTRNNVRGPGISSFQDILLVAPVIVYINAETDRFKILLGNKGKTGIYQWTHLKSSKRYIGSAVDLSKRLMYYYNKNYLNRDKNMYICNAIITHTYSAFSLSILEYINIKSLSKEDARKLILDREQHYFDTF